MDESNVVVTLLLFAGLFLNWSKAVISAAIAIIIRNRALSLVVVLIVGALEGLFGSRLELFDLYLSRTGWQAVDALMVITVVLSAPVVDRRPRAVRAGTTRHSWARRRAIGSQHRK